MNCTTIDCERLTETYLCNQCVSDLQQWIDKGRALIPDMTATIYRLDNIRQPSTGGGGGPTGSKPPINLHALETRDWLQRMVDAKTYAQDQMAAGWAWEVQAHVKEAELMVSGPEPDQPKNTLEARRKLAVEVPPALKTPQLAEWLRVTHSINIKETRIRKWAERGLITRNNETGHPTYDPTTVLIQARKDAA